MQNWWQLSGIYVALDSIGDYSLIVICSATSTSTKECMFWICVGCVFISVRGMIYKTLFWRVETYLIIDEHTLVIMIYRANIPQKYIVLELYSHAPISFDGLVNGWWSQFVMMRVTNFKHTIEVVTDRVTSYHSKHTVKVVTTFILAFWVKTFIMCLEVVTSVVRVVTRVTSVCFNPYCL